jgi:antitoxin ParD1/3/4
LASKTIDFTELHQRMVDSLVQSGKYRDASEVVRDGLRLIERRENEDAARLEALREAARKGIDAIESGDYRQFESFAELERHLIASTEALVGGKAKR